MPKRRMTPARRAQIKKWQSARWRARTVKNETTKYATKPWEKKGAVPRGKQFFLYHTTSPDAAKEIVKKRVWKTGPNEKGRVFFTQKQPDLSKIMAGYGSATVRVKVRRKEVTKVRFDTAALGAGPVWSANRYTLSGRKVKRVR